MIRKPDEPWKNGGERALAFVQEHGGTPVWDSVERVYLLPDGAVMALDGMRFGPPPTDLGRQLNRRRLYCRLLVERTQAHLDELAAVGRGEKLDVRWRTELYGVGPASIADAHRHLTTLLAEQRRALAAVESERHALHAACP